MSFGVCAGLYQSGDWLLFGAETTGLPQEVGPFCGTRMYGLQEVSTSRLFPVSEFARTPEMRRLRLSLQVYDSLEQSGGVVVRVPIVETHVRSLNLAVSQGIGLYEAMRQIDGPPAVQDAPH